MLWLRVEVDHEKRVWPVCGLSVQLKELWDANLAPKLFRDLQKFFLALRLAQKQKGQVATEGFGYRVLRRLVRLYVEDEGCTDCTAFFQRTQVTMFDAYLRQLPCAATSHDVRSKHVVKPHHDHGAAPVPSMLGWFEALAIKTGHEDLRRNLEERRITVQLLH